MVDRNVHLTYWAAEPDVLSLVSELNEKVGDFDRHVDTSGRWLTWRDLYYNYFLVNEQNYIFPNYAADGFKRLNINHFRNYLKHLLSLVTAQRVVPEPIATNSDAKSQAQTNFCKNILSYENKEKKMDKIFESSTEIALLLGGAYISLEWDATLGEVYGADPETQQAQKKGDYVVDVYNPLDCIFDFASSGWDKTNWCILRKYYNRWDLVAKFPAYADQIKSLSIAPETKRHRLGHLINEKNDDLISLYTFYHKKTPVLPEGRATLFLDANTCLFDGALPYKRVPVHRIAADEQINSPFPYSVSMDILPIQKVYNALCSAVCTNQAAFGVQNVLIPRECAIALSQLTEGLNAIYYDSQITNGAKPEALNLLMTKEETFRWIEYLEKKMMQISGVNDTIQGNPAANLKSGTALAFVAAQALTFISPLSRSYNSILESVWTGIVDILKEFATTPRMLLISGLNNKSDAKEFTSEDIADIDRVIVEAGNPLTQTLAGRIQIAQDLIQAGLINKEEYMTVFQTGQLEPLYAYEKTELMCIKQSIEALQAGKQVKPLKTDNHPLFIREYLTILSTPEVRNAPDNPVLANTIAAISQHAQLWQQITQSEPWILATQNIPPFPSPQPAPAPEEPKKSVSYKDLPPDGQIQLAAQAGIKLDPAHMAAMAVSTPGQPPMAAKPGVNTGKENPNGSKHAGAQNLPGMMQNHRPGEAPTIAAPNAPKPPQGTPAITEDAMARMASAVPQQPPVPGQ